MNIEFRKFGVMGFTGIVDKRKYELTNKYENIVKEYFKPFWKLPWVLVLIILVLLLPKFFRKEELLIIVCIAVVNELSARFLKWSYRMFKKLKYGKKPKWLFKEILEKHTPSTFSYLGLYLSYKLLESNKSDVLDYEYIISLILSFYFIYTIIYIYVVRIKIPLKTKEYLKQTYPEYEFTK